ncbi:energy transducer TonB [Longimicrobium sp.]|uniref:energy transducer TonB n=1 Tax=Longimicrobium sp. TaxID=2029185 RepID=UPI003B3A0632
MTNRRLLVSMAALLACAACASAGSGAAPGRASLLSDAPASLDRPCRPSPAPAQLPAADALVDSAALIAAAGELWRGAGSPRGHVLLAMAYDEAGLNVRRDLIEHRLPPAMADSLQKLVFAHRRTADAAPREWGVRLRMDMGGEQPVLRVGRREVCPAQVRDAAVAGYGAFGGTPFGDVRERSAPTAILPAGGSGGGTVWVRVALDAGGHVTEARLERTPFGRAGWENRVLSYVRAISFVPATEDGWPVPGQLMFPLRLNR